MGDRPCLRRARQPCSLGIFAGQSGNRPRQCRRIADGHRDGGLGRPIGDAAHRRSNRRHTGNRRLEQQALSLQASEDRLKLQQEELQQTNEELEERSELLQLQNAEVERKNREIEQAKIELEERAP